MRKLRFDAVRGLAALLVVVCHTLAALVPVSVFGIAFGEKQTSFMHYPPMSLLSAGHFAVCLFFVLSGYVLSKANMTTGINSRNFFAMCLKRPIRLGGVVWVTAVLGFLLLHFGLFKNQTVASLTGSAWLTQFWPAPINLMSFLSMLARGPFQNMAAFNPPLWTIALELYGSLLIFGLLYVFSFIKHANARVFILVALFAALARTPYCTFIAGMLITMITRVQVSAAAQYALLLIAIFGACYPCYLQPKMPYLPQLPLLWGGWASLGGIAMVTYLAVAPAQLETFLSKTPFTFLGRVSYGLYGAHFLVLGTLVCLIYAWGIGVGLPTPLIFASCFILSIVLSLIFAWLLWQSVDLPSTRIANWIGRRVNAGSIPR